MKRIITKEKIYGNMATVFHRTSYSNLINAVYTEGFKPGSGDMYGKGFYSTYEKESQERRHMASTYGSIVVKFGVPVKDFFIFDWEEFQKLGLSKELNATKDNFLTKQAEYYDLNIMNDFRREKLPGNFIDDLVAKKHGMSSDTAQYMINNTNIENKVRGIVFTGRRDGKVLVAYDTSIIMPLSYKVDGEKEFSKVERNKEYMKKVLKRKLSVFDPEEKEERDLEWLELADFDRNNVVYKFKNGKVIWESGTWQDGTWYDGTWKNGTWIYGIWYDGLWEDGTWESGTWKSGTWENGIWKSGVWKRGTWEKGRWIDGIWKNGEWRDGLWKGGIWENGLWENGTWKDGSWLDGTWNDGRWIGGTWRGGIWYDGLWERGEWRFGFWGGGIWKGGSWLDGKWNDGTWENGVWEDGLWKGGVWKEGVWYRGKIFDPELNKFMRSDISPKEYFERKKR